MQKMLAKNKKKNELKSMFRALMTAPPPQVAIQAKSLITKLQKSSDSLDRLICKVYSDFPDDIGIFCIYLLNIVELNPGCGIFLGPNEPHAYLEGECMECMACSDNVVRAGLTPKFKDVDTLVNMLTYNTQKIDILTGTNVQSSPKELVYVPPVEEFQISRITVEAGSTAYKPKKATGPSIYVTLEGEGILTANSDVRKLGRGIFLFVYANTEVTISCTKNLSIYRATTNIHA